MHGRVRSRDREGGRRATALPGWDGRGSDMLVGYRTDRVEEDQPATQAAVRAGFRRHEPAGIQRLHIGPGSACDSAYPGSSQSLRLRSEEHTSELQSLMRNSYAV